MQIINVSGNSVAENYQDLCDKLSQYGTGYFDRYEFDETNVKVDCYIGEDVALSIKYDNSYGLLYYYNQESNLRYGSNSYRYISRMVVCDNCIFLVPDSNAQGSNPTWVYPLFLTKKVDGSTAIVCGLSGINNTSTINGLSIWTTSTFYGSVIGVISFDNTTRIGRQSLILIGVVDANYVATMDATQINATQMYDPYDGVMIKDFYCITACGIHQQEPGYFSVDGVRYVGLSKYTFASKDE